MIKVSSLNHLGTGILPKPVPVTLRRLSFAAPIAPIAVCSSKKSSGREYNDDPNYITFASQFEAGSGDHFLRSPGQGS